MRDQVRVRLGRHAKDSVQDTTLLSDYAVQETYTSIEESGVTSTKRFNVLTHLSIEELLGVGS